MKGITPVLTLFLTACFINFVGAQTATGDLEAYLNSYIDNIPGNSGDNFTPPTAGNLISWESAVRDILAGDIATARATAATFNYIVTEYTDTNHLPGQVYHILEENDPSLSKYWGSYVFNTTPLRPKLILQTVHARFDTNTGDEAAYGFTRLSAKAFFIQGTHRCNHSTASSCSGTSSACGPSGPFKISDLAHNDTTVFQKTTEIVGEDISTVFIQLHGFSQGGGDPEVIMSNGTDQVPSGTDYVTAIRDELLNVDASLTFKIPHIDIGWTRLIGTTNTQGRHLNQSANPCNTAATSATGRFVHMEQAFSLRSNATGWDKIYLALSNVFGGCATDNTPPVIDCQDLIVELDTSGNGILTPAILNGLATDDCTTATVTASKTSFVCADMRTSPSNNMVITGIVEGDINATNIKAIEVTILKDILDISVYGMGVANNGGGTDGIEFNFPSISAAAGDKFLITNNATTFNTFFGFAPNFVNSTLIFFNGDDAVELFLNSTVIDRFGEPTVDGTGEIWEYTNGWAYRVTDTQPDGTVFVSDHWTYSGIGANVGAINNGGASTQFPIESYQILPNSQPVRVEATDIAGNISTCLINVIIKPWDAVYSGGNWSPSPPGAGANAKINADYNTSASGNSSIDACTCEIGNNATLTVEAGDYLNINNDITVDSGSSLIVEHTANVVQTDDMATVINNGTINVLQTTPNLASRDFLILGSPMTGETRTSVWNAAFIVLDATTANFVPHPQVAIDFPGAENFADDNNNYWQFYNGALPINPGEAYLVRPQAGYGQPGGIFNYNYDDGTLNTGDVTFNVGYNTPGPTGADNKNASPNALANPYPSAIFADDFINGNAMVDEVYFWEHLTPPSPLLPGAGTMNFSMEDISMYNLSGGVGAGNPEVIATRPNGYISTGQGFGIKATGAGTATFTNAMRRTNNNNTLRNPNDKDRLWLNIENSTYEMGGATLIAFNENATPGVDNGYDSRRLATVVSLYSHLEDGSEQLAIQTREAFQSGMQVPVGFSSQLDETLDYKISISTIEGENLDGATVYLIDHYTNTVTNLSDTAYVFTSEKGTFHGRFTLQFEGEVVLGSNDNLLDSVSIFPNPTDGILNIVSPMDPINAIEVFDMRGRLIHAAQYNNQNSIQLDMTNLRSSVYFVQLNTISGNKLTKRVVKR